MERPCASLARGEDHREAAEGGHAVLWQLLHAGYAQLAPRCVAAPPPEAGAPVLRGAQQPPCIQDMCHIAYELALAPMRCRSPGPFTGLQVGTLDNIEQGKRYVASMRHNWSVSCLLLSGKASAWLPDPVVAVGAGTACCASKRIPPGSLRAHDTAEESLPGLAQQYQLEGRSAETPAGRCAAHSFWSAGPGLPGVDLLRTGKQSASCSYQPHVQTTCAYVRCAAQQAGSGTHSEMLRPNT